LGRTPIREALKRLRTEQLVVWLDRESPYVPEIGLAQVRSLYEARSIFETQIAVLAAERITQTAADRLDDLIAQEADLLERGMVYEAVEMALQFHQGIAEATGNSFLVDASTRINTCALRIWHDTAVAEETPAQEHADIVDALRRHNTYDAVAAVQRHNTNAYQRYSHTTLRA
jgi:DNA-binding GntR family transcriptional regulator